MSILNNLSFEKTDNLSWYQNNLEHLIPPKAIKTSSMKSY